MIQRHFLYLFLSAIFICCSISMVNAQDTPEKVVEAWLILWDEGKYEDFYKLLAEDTRQRFTERDWFNYWIDVRYPLGKLKSRKFAARKYINQERLLFVYAGSYENKETIIEMCAVIREKDGNWRVWSYYTP